MKSKAATIATERGHDEDRWSGLTASERARAREGLVFIRGAVCAARAMRGDASAVAAERHEVTS